MQHRRATAASMFQNGISRNTKCDNMVGFPKSSHICYSNCGLINSDGDVVDIDNPDDAYESINDVNECCNTVSTTTGYGIPGTCITACKFSYNH